MKYLLLLPYCLLFACSGFAQHTDTVRYQLDGKSLLKIRDYYENGTVSRETFKTISGKADTTTIGGRKLTELSNEDLFMRGIRVTQNSSEAYIRRDSVHHYHPNYKLDRKRFFHPAREMIYIYDTDWRLLYIEEKTREENLQPVFIDNIQLDVSENHQRLFGRIGAWVPAKFQLTNRSNQDVALTVQSSKTNATYPARLLLTAGETVTLSLALLVDQLQESVTFHLQNREKRSIDFTVQLEGYHLSEDDFQTATPTQDARQIQAEEELRLLLTGAEKLIHVRKDNGQLLKTLSVPHTINKISLKNLPTGIYELVLVDLGNQQEKYCRVER